MKIEVLAEERVLVFFRRQPPDARKQLRSAIHAIERGESFPEPLDDELNGFYKLRVGDYRLILQFESAKTGPRFKIVFAERRNVVYELFKHMLGME